MIQDLSPHKTLIEKEWHNRTGYLNKQAWAALEDLLWEAKILDLPRRLQHLEGLRADSPTIDGWGTRRLVEAMGHESKPDGPAPAAFLGLPVPFVPQQLNGHAQEPKRKEGLLARLRGR